MWPLWASGASVWALFKVLAVVAFLLQKVHLSLGSGGGLATCRDLTQITWGSCRGAGGETLWVPRRCHSPCYPAHRCPRPS